MPAELDFRLSAAARRDIGQIGDYGAEQFGDAMADAYLRGLADAFALLCRHPHAGEHRSELQPGIRCWIYRRHRIFYRVTTDEIYILRILHHSRDSSLHLSR